MSEPRDRGNPVTLKVLRELMERNKKGLCTATHCKIYEVYYYVDDPMATNTPQIACPFCGRQLLK